jgi:CDGSH-type Zn-finger protein
VKALPNGPLMVRGEFVVQDSRGEPIVIEDSGMILLCRCGNSERKPLCDGSHKRLGFKG